ncbi:YadA-like family protein [Veillonella sp. CHU732]|uniref:YadA-like family protein n=1 Tax=Veillonella sp. CHU732 TaxID=2490949 RepID=UPI000F8F1BEC|nr:YadA-like family protein [Veillonella sp. CHU732]
MKERISKKRKKYGIALLAATAATVATSFSPSAPWVMASVTASDTDPNLPDDFNPPIYTEVPHDQDTDKINIPLYHVQAGNNVSVTTNTFKAEDFNGDEATFNNFIVKANDTVIEDSGDIVVDKGESENAEKSEENGVTRRYKLKLSDSLKEELKNAAGGGGGAAPSKFENGTNTTVEGDGTENSPYKYNVNPALTGITSITGDTLTLNGGATTVAINDDGVNVGGKKITNLKEGDVSENSTDAVTGKQLHETNETVKEKLDKTAERHIKPGDYTVENGTVTLTYVDGDGNDTTDKAKITGLSSLKSVASGDEDKLTVANNNGDITVTPVVATDITKADDANKLATAGVVNTAITNATSPLANKNLSNITDDGKKVITGLGTEVVQGNGVTVTSSEDAATGKKTYTISANAAQPNFANGTNTTVEGDGTAATPYKYNVNPALTGITSITNAAPVDPAQPDAKVASTTLTIGSDALTVENKQADGATSTVKIGKDGIDAGGKTITNVADPTGDKDAANKEYVDSKVWGLKVQNGDNPAEAVTAKDKAITLKASADTSDDATKPKKGLVIAKDDQGNITLGLEKADRTTLDNAANLGNTGSDGRDGQAGKNATGVVAGAAGAQGPTGKDGLNGKDLTSKVNALRNGEAGTVVYTNEAGERVVKANDGKYYPAGKVNADGTKADDAVAVTPEARLVNPDGTTAGDGSKLSNIAPGTVSATSKDAVNGSQLFNERVTSPVIFVDKDGNQVFKNADGKFTTKDGVEITDADELAKIHTKVNADKPMTLDNVASAVKDLTGTTYLDKLAEGAKQDSKVANSAVNVTDLHAATTAILDKPITFIGDNDTNDKIERKLGETLKIHGVNNITVTKDAVNADTLNVALKPTLTGITSITNATTADGDGTKLTIDGDKLSVVNKNGADTATVTIGKDGIDAGGKAITNVAEPTNDKDAANKEYVDAQKWGLKVQNGDNPAEAVAPKNKAITLKASADTSDDEATPKKGLLITKDDQGNITVGLDKATRATLDKAANIGNTSSDGRDGQTGANGQGTAVAGTAGATGLTSKDGLNGKDVTTKVNALRNGESGIVVYTNAAGDRLVKANDGKYYKADEVELNGEKKPGATAVPTKEVIASLISPDGTTAGDGNKLSNIAPGTVSATSRDAVNGSQLFNERVTSPVIFVDKDGNQVFKNADGKFTTKDGAEITDADELAKIHTKVNAEKPMTLDNVASAIKDLTGNTYLDKLAEGAKTDSKVANSAVNVTDLHNTANALVTKGLDFQGNLGDAIHKDLGAKLDIVGEGTVAADAATAANNIRTKNVDGKLEIGLVKDLKNITSITNAAPVDPAQPDAKVASTTLTIGGDALTVENKQADGTKATVTIGKDGIDAGGKKITNVEDPTDDKDVATKKYVDDHAWDLHVDDGTGTGHTVIPKDKVITFKAGTGTIAPTDLPAGQDSPTKDTDGLRPKTGVVVETDKNGTITIGLEEADRKTLDKAANIGNTGSDGRDGKAGAGQDGANVDGTAGAQGPTGKDGLNGKDLTSKVNALRNGEAGTVVYTNEAGERVVKANDGKYYPVGKVNADGTKADDAVAVTPEARLVNPDGTTTNGTTVLNNISSVVTPLAGTDTLEKLKEAAKDNSPVKNAATNVTDLHNTANAIVEKGLTFKGNAGDEIHKNLGEKLDIVGEGTVASDAATAANNIRTKNVDGKLEIGLVKDLKNITSITNAAPVDPAQPDAKVASTTLTIDGDALTVENKQADGTKATVKIGKDGIDAGGKKITNVAEPTENSDVATKEYVDNQAWNLHVDDGTGTGHTVIPRNKVITFKAGTGTVAPTNLPAGQDSPTKDTDGLRPKAGVVVETDKNGTITIGLEKAERKTLDDAANIGNTASDGRDGKAGAGQDGVAVAGTAGKEGPTGKDGLNGKDLTSKVNALRNGEAGTVVFTNATGDRLVKANDGNYYKADQVEPNGAPKAGATAVATKDVTVSLVSPDGTTKGAQNKLSNIADGTVSETSKDAVNGSQLFNERVTNPTIFVDKDGNQVFKTTKGQFVDKNGAEVSGAVHTKLNAGAPMTLDNVASALDKPAEGVDYLAKLKEAKEGNTVNNSAVNVTDLHNTANAILEKGLTFEGDTANDTVKRKLGDTLKIHGDNNITVKKDATNPDTLNVSLKPTLTGITSITNAATADGAGTTLTINGDGLTVENKQADGTKATVTIGKDGINAGNTKVTNVAAGQNDTDAVNVSQLKGIANYATNVDSRVNRLGAQSAAMAGLRHLQYDPLEPTTVMAGVGTYKGQTALALGIAHYKNESLLFHAGASIGSNHDELMANAGVSWKFGSRADETAVKDAYRQGPISSSYTLQDKVSALEAQNQLQKDEINELKAQLAEVLKYVKKG